MYDGFLGPLGLDFFCFLYSGSFEAAQEHIEICRIEEFSLTKAGDFNPIPGCPLGGYY